MQCPVCKDAKLVMAERQGVEIDYCPTCRGVWLDRGELDKIIERSQGGSGASEGRPPDREERAETRHEDDPRKRKRRGFLGEPFDFD